MASRGKHFLRESNRNVKIVVNYHTKKKKKSTKKRPPKNNHDKGFGNNTTVGKRR